MSDHSPTHLLTTRLGRALGVRQPPCHSIPLAPWGRGVKGARTPSPEKRTTKTQRPPSDRPREKLALFKYRVLLARLRQFLLNSFLCGLCVFVVKLSALHRRPRFNLTNGK